MAAVPAVAKRQAERQKKPAIHPHPAVLQQEAQLKEKPKKQKQMNQPGGVVKKVDTRPADQQLVIPGFDLFEVIGKGGMGKVYRARQLSLNRIVAIKVLNEDLAKHKSFIRRFEKETASLAVMNHPNISAIIDRGHHANSWFFVMEYIDGPSLRQKINAGKLEMLPLLNMFQTLCSAIAHAHRRGVIHRDLKPENVLFTQDGVLKVVDFGLANILDDQRRWELTRTKVSMGTVNYMAPEQRRDAKHVDQRADIYSLGVMLYELLAGELPLGRFDPPSKHRPQVSKRLDKLVLKMLDFEPDQRPQEVEFIVATIEKVRQDYARAESPRPIDKKTQSASPYEQEQKIEKKNEQDALAQMAIDSLSSVSSDSPVVKSRTRRGRFKMLALLVTLVGLVAATAAVFFGMLSSDLSKTEGDLVINTSDDGPVVSMVFPQQVKHLPPVSFQSAENGASKARFDFKPSRLPTMPVRLTRGNWKWDEMNGLLIQDTCLNGVTVNQRPALAAFGPTRPVQDLSLVAKVHVGPSEIKPGDSDQAVDLQHFLSERFSKIHKLTTVDSADKVGLGFVNEKGEGVLVAIALRGSSGKVTRTGADMDLGDETFSIKDLGMLSGSSHKLRLEMHDGRILLEVDNRSMLDSLAGLPLGFKGAPAITCQNARCEFDSVEFSLAVSSMQP